MKSILPLLPFVAALGLIACQGGDGPVADDAVNAAAVSPAGEEGLGWTSDANDTVASFGPAGTAPMLSFTCTGPSGGRYLLVRRFHPAQPGTSATLSFSGSGHASSMPMRSVAMPGGPGESEWQGEARGDMARAVARTFAGKGVVEVTLGGSPGLAVPASPVVDRVLSRCA